MFLIAKFYIAITFFVLPLCFLLACILKACAFAQARTHTCVLGRASMCVYVCAVTRGNLKPCHKAAFAIFLLTHR